MDELLLALIILIFKALAWLVKSVFKGISGAVRALGRAQSGQTDPSNDKGGFGPREAAPSARPRPAPASPARRAAPPARLIAPSRGADPTVVPWLQRLDEVARRAGALAERCAGEPQNAGFVEFLEERVADTALEVRRRLGQSGAAGVRQAAGNVAFLELLLSIIDDMAAQRRDDDTLLLLGDSDALAEACYAPLVEHARGHNVDLAVRRIATLLTDEDLAAWVPRRVGLAAILLPPEWPVEIAWWPALVHEVGHSYWAAAGQLEAELRANFRLPRTLEGLVNDRDPDAEGLRPYATWLEEIFADAFGVMMLGPAYVMTMAWAFRSPDDQRAAVLCQTTRDLARYDEHPPAHLRVLLGCALLEEMGYAEEARQIERRWRAEHPKAVAFLLLTRSRRWAVVDEDALVAPGRMLVVGLYEAGYRALDTEALNDIPGLDFGPREHRMAQDVARALLAGQVPSVRDPRCLIAGAVLARFERPLQAATILLNARAAIPAVGVSRRRLRLRVADAEAAVAAREAADGEDLLGDAILLGALLAPPPGRRIHP